MTAIATRGAKPSNVLAYELFPEHGYCRSVDTVTVEAGMDIGAVVQLDSGKYTWVAAADVATLNADVRIVIDLETANTAAGDASLVTLAFGPSAIAKGGLLFKDTLTSGNKATVYAALEAKGIRCLTQV